LPFGTAASACTLAIAVKEWKWTGRGFVKGVKEGILKRLMKRIVQKRRLFLCEVNEIS
jgi:hypothetical protein